MKEFAEERLRPIMINFFEQIAREGISLHLDHVPAYNERAQFVGGKVINFCCFTALELLKSKEDFEKLSSIIKMAADMKMETWGILNGLSGLYRLKKAGLLEQIVDAKTLDKLKKSLDWRSFVDVENHYALIHKPTNYYGVAFGIARHRELLGWDEEGHSKNLLERLEEHIEQFSGKFLFMDETPGEGRFDRYSILVPSELVSQLLGTGWEVPVKIRKMLKKSAQIFLQLANESGVGFSYGRSIGAYGDTAALEVLSAAAVLGDIMSDEEMEIAYGYSVKLLEHMVDFWYDKNMGSVNMWEHGRRTDNYRNKNRILGENLSLCMQMVNSVEHWEQSNYDGSGQGAKALENYPKMLKTLPHFSYIPFAQGEYQRGLAIIRDGHHVWSLPLISGGQKYYDKDPYMPVPFENLVLQGVPECNHGQLVPQFVLDNGEILMPIVYFKTISASEKDGCVEVLCTMDGLCRMNNGIFVNDHTEFVHSLEDNSIAGNSPASQLPQKAEKINVTTCYRFEKNQISREDRLELSERYPIKKIRLVCFTYSDQPDRNGNTMNFKEGIIQSVHAEGYDTCELHHAAEDGSCDTPHGRFNYEVVWEREVRAEEDKFHISWNIVYQ